MFNIEAGIREANAQSAREAKSPVVVYDRGGSHGTANLANIGDYLLAVGGYPPDYTKARVVQADDLELIEKARRLILEARKAADKLYASAFANGTPVTPETADAARKKAQR